MKISASTLICLVSGAASIAVVFIPFHFVAAPDAQKALDFFQEHLRESLFIGLLTVATFLFSLKTFIIVTMNDKVYSTKEYEDEWRKKRKLNDKLRRFAPLENFAHLLFLAVLISLIGASLQFSLGLVPSLLAAETCITISVWSIAMIFVSLFYLQQNLRSWFKFLDSNDATK